MANHLSTDELRQLDWEVRTKLGYETESGRITNGSGTTWWNEVGVLFPEGWRVPLRNMEEGRAFIESELKARRLMQEEEEEERRRQKERQRRHDARVVAGTNRWYKDLWDWIIL